MVIETAADPTTFASRISEIKEFAAHLLIAHLIVITKMHSMEVYKELGHSVTFDCMYCLFSQPDVK